MGLESGDLLRERRLRKAYASSQKSRDLTGAKALLRTNEEMRTGGKGVWD